VRNRIWVVVAVVVALGGGLGLGALLFGGDDGDDDDGGGEVASGSTTDESSSGDDATTTTGGDSQGPPTPSTLPDLPATTVPVEGLTGADLELAEAINRAHQLTYHILLRSTDPESPNETELWRRLPNARRDVRLGDGDAHLETREFRSPEGGHIGCLIDTSGSGQTTCVEAPPGQLDPADPVLGALDPTLGEVTASDATLNGAPVRCFGQTIDGAERVACFDADGIPAVLDGGDGRLERVGEPERGVTDDVFVPPDASFVPNSPGPGSDDDDSGDDSA
jgi:hypothetical protein